MKKFLITIVILAAIGYGGYRVALNYVSNKVVAIAQKEWLTDEQISKAKQYANIDQLAKEVSQVDKSKLPFHTKEDAVKTVMKKFSTSELADAAKKVKGGATPQEKQELMQLAEQRLSPDELAALKVVALQELQKQSK
ncbi:hypothetical protein [Priestia koreensis]|uniref:Uncharacterized protein n=1 Tax=Priestia koreensis TaxID=284581 RepID=A0A0M0L9M0_9BACI|nr:hypothetical protein [Priestia koreensis]KOO47547.1 hypothetical protein AMD01_05765 [Priestia koreensis]